jgi:hypothetical protein
MTTNGEHVLLHEMLIDEFDSIFEKRWTVTGANGESSATFTMSVTTFFSMLPVFPGRIPPGIDPGSRAADLDRHGSCFCA